MMNSSYNVGRPQLRRLQQEFARAEQMVAKILRSKGKWDELFQDGRSFFRQHVHFVQVSITAEDDDSFRVWQGYCESRLRNLIAALESKIVGTQAHPFAQFFRQNNFQVDDDGDNATSEESSQAGIRRSLFYVALRFSPDVESVDLKPLLGDFLNMLNTWEEREDGMDLDVDVLLQDELPLFVLDDEDTCTCIDDQENGQQQQSERS
jgi:poly(A) polymerase Pap1